MASITKRNGKWQVRVAWRDTQGNWKSRNKGGFPTKTAHESGALNKSSY